jgi:ATP-binding cassette subfamily B (MDR/TAP) protein 1
MLAFRTVSLRISAKLRLEYLKVWNSVPSDFLIYFRSEYADM